MSEVNVDRIISSIINKSESGQFSLQSFFRNKICCPPPSWHFLTLRNSSFCDILFFMHACIAYCIGQTRTNISRASQCSNFLPELYTGCPNKHGNSVTNSISSFQIILWISIVIPTEKAVICKIFVCYVYNLFVYVYRLHCSSCGYIINTSLVFYPLHKINSSRHNNIIAFEIRCYKANS